LDEIADYRDYLADGKSNIEFIFEEFGGAGNDLRAINWESVEVGVELDGEFFSLEACLENGLDSIIVGSNSGEVLNGNGDNNLIFGFGGNDTINGGAGADNLTGGSGSDQFILTTLGDSGTGASADQITDFEDSGDDKIDVSGNGLSFIGAADFNGDDQIRVEQSGADTLVKFNTSGGTATVEHEILLLDTLVTSITAEDFILS
jgi:Ca2+-binding RTX toxin-like protein